MYMLLPHIHVLLSMVNSSSCTLGICKHLMYKLCVYVHSHVYIYIYIYIVQIYMYLIVCNIELEFTQLKANFHSLFELFCDR